MFEADAEVEGKLATIRRPGAVPAHYHKPHWHTDKNAAIAQAVTMRAKKIEALKRQIRVLKALEFA